MIRQGCHAGNTNGMQLKLNALLAMRCMSHNKSCLSPWGSALLSSEPLALPVKEDIPFGGPERHGLSKHTDDQGASTSVV